MRPHGSPKTLERRRRCAITLLSQGLSLREVARRVQASVTSVHRWQQAWAHGGDRALAPKPVSGRPRKLTDAQCQQLLHVLSQGARAYGFANELWTVKRIAVVIQQTFGVHYHPAHVWKLLRSVGWSCQMPERRPIQRNEPAIAHWKRSTWPAIKKSLPVGSPPRLSG